MKGQKYNDDIKEKAIAMLTVNNSVSYVAKKLELPRSTVKTWKIQFDKQALANGEATSREEQILKGFEDY